MIDKYMRKYCEQMDKVTLSEAADQAVLDDMLKADSRKGVTYMKWTKRNISVAAVAAVIAITSVTTVCASVVGTIIKSNKAKSQVEGVGAKVNVGKSGYYDLLAGDTGEVYALTNNEYNSASIAHHVVAWRSTDQGDTWEEVLSLPAEQIGKNSVIAGDLRKGETGIEAVVIMSEGTNDEQVNRVYQITADSCIEYDIDEVSTQLGGSSHLVNVKYVNEHIIALAGAEKCLLYDTDTQKIVKNLPYDLTMICLKTQDQFLLYGKEIYSCLDAETLEEQTPEEGLQEFVKTMSEKNLNQVAPPMTAWNDTIVCVTKLGIFEYTDGKTTQIRQTSHVISDGHVFNGLLPICKTGDGKYYVGISEGGGMALWQVDGDKEEIK